MAGFGGATHSVMGNLYRQLQSQDPQQTGDVPGGLPADAPPPGEGPGESGNFNYGGLGNYNTLAQDMSRNVMGPWGFNQGMFNYTPYGNPYAQPPAPPPQQPPPGGPPGWPDDFPGDRWDRGPKFRDQDRFLPKPMMQQASWPGWGQGGMPGRHNQGNYQPYGGMYGGGMHGSYGTPYARPWRGPQAGGMYGKPQFPGWGYGGMATTNPVGPMDAMW